MTPKKGEPAETAAWVVVMEVVVLVVDLIDQFRARGLEFRV